MPTNLGKIISERRLQLGKTLDDVGRDVGVSKSTVQRWESGNIQNMRRDKLVGLARALATTPAYLMGWTDDPEDYEQAEELDSLPEGWLDHFNGDVKAAVRAYRAMDEERVQEFALPPGALPITMQRVPLLGGIHAGEPTYAEEDFDGYAVLGSAVRCDFALRVVGDSMINARIYDGDIVFIRKQDTVENGEIAAVLIDDETTLKRVRFIGGGMTMFCPENPKYEPIVVGGAGETRNVRILGKAVAFQGDVK